jgi:restriction system protein
MAIWHHDDTVPPPRPALLERRCLYCCTDLTRFFRAEYEKRDHGRGLTSHRDWSHLIDVCSVCGWWIARKRYANVRPGDGGINYTAGMAVLKELNLANASVPIAEVQKYLLARYERRFEVHPRLFEETVASVFRDHGYDVVVTGYSGDGGVDVILTHSGREIGVQVKRYRSKIKVEQIRQLVGALVLRGLTTGMFVTTSDFQRGAELARREYRSRGFRIELINASAFYDALRLTQREMYSTAEDFFAANDLDWLHEIRFSRAFRADSMEREFHQERIARSPDLPSVQ